MARTQVSQMSSRILNDIYHEDRVPRNPDQCKTGVTTVTKTMWAAAWTVHPVMNDTGPGRDTAMIHAAERITLR